MPRWHHPDPDAVRVQLQQVLASRFFSRSKRLSRFLRFIVEAQLEGRGDQIKERTIGIEVFERGSKFDPSSDNIVRIEAARLRHKLRDYYEAHGNSDPIRIDVPKGGYSPVFQCAETDAPDRAPETAPGLWNRYAVIGLKVAALLVVAAAFVLRFSHSRSFKPKPEVEALYRTARSLWNRRTVNSLKQSVDLYKEAIRREPTYADAWAGLADSYAVLVGNDYPDSALYVNDGIDASRHAITLNPRAGRPHAALASFYHYTMSFNAAERENKLAIQLSPGDAVVHQWYGHFLMSEHRYQEALGELNKAQQLDPSQPMIGVNLGEVYFWMGDHNKALQCFYKVLKEHPDSIAGAIGVEGVHMARRQYAAALEDVNRRLAMFPDDPGLNANRRICLQALGRMSRSHQAD